MKKTITVFILGIILQLFLTNFGAGYGGRIAGLEEEITLVKEENHKLELQIAKRLSYFNIAQNSSPILRR